MTHPTATVTLGAHSGGRSAGVTISPPLLALRAALSEHCRGPYSPDVVEFALILRIDGDITHWDLEGCKYLRRSFKERYITIDIFVPQERWQGKTSREIRQYFADGVREALSLCIKRLKKDKTPVDGERLMSDFEKAAAEYLKQES